MSDEVSVTAIPSFQPLRKIAHGAFGYVFEAYDYHRTCKVAVKRTQKAGNIVSREYEVLSLLRGAENIVQLLDFFYSVDVKHRIIQNMVLEYCECSLESTLQRSIKEKTTIPMPELKRVLK